MDKTKDKELLTGEVIVIHVGEDACDQCLGWKRVDHEGQSWQYWEELPSASTLAVKMGLVTPEICPRCEGTGIDPDAEQRAPKIAFTEDEWQIAEWMEEFEPDNGWWKSDAEESIEKKFRYLISKGLTIDEAGNVISSIISTISGEYGN